jgi:hypothetical protein
MLEKVLFLLPHDTLANKDTSKSASGEQKVNMLISCPCLVRSCKETILNIEGIAHSVEVTEASLYEAVEGNPGNPFVMRISGQFNSGRG